jgi:hypothetical protein
MYDLQVAQLKLGNNFPLCPMRAILPDKSIVYVQMLQQKYTDSDTGNKYFFFLWRCNPTRVIASSFLMFLNHTQRRTTVGWTTLDE